MTERRPWPDDWPEPAELYAITDADLADITDAGCLVAQAGIPVRWQALARSPFTWASTVQAAVTTAAAFATPAELLDLELGGPLLDQRGGDHTGGQ